MPRRTWDLPALVAGVEAGEKRAVARAITLVENGDALSYDLVRELYGHTGGAVIVGFTGPPGVGKSTLLAALVGLLRRADRTVGVISVDPSSPFSRGAVLGDRIRLADHFLDPGVFIRSMSTRGHLGGLSEATLQAMLVLDASGKDVILLETVGVGQSEVEVLSLADTVVLIVMPGSGDSVQALKAGIMEIPDVIAINKADHPATNTLRAEIRSVLMLDREREWTPPIVETEALSGRGVEALWNAVCDHRAHLEVDRLHREAARLDGGHVQQVLAQAVHLRGEVADGAGALARLAVARGEGALQHQRVDLHRGERVADVVGDDAEHLVAGADGGLGGGARLVLALQQPLALHRVAQRAGEHPRLHLPLHQVVLRPRLHRLDRHRLVVEPRQHHDRHLGRGGEGARHRLQTMRVGEGEVEQHHVGVARGELRERGGEAVGVPQLEGERAGVAQRLADQPRVARVVLHQQDAQRRRVAHTRSG